MRWVQMEENLSRMMLDQQIELVGLYGKIGQSGKISQTKYTRNLDERTAQELNDSNLRQSRKEDHDDVRLELKAQEPVLPHLRQPAYQQGGDWVYPYEETLEKHGRNKKWKHATDKQASQNPGVLDVCNLDFSGFHVSDKQS